MGLKTKTIQKAVSAAFKALGELVQPITYRRTTSVYNPATGQMVKTNTDYTVKAVITDFSNYEIDRVTVLAFDRKVIVQTKDMPVVPVVATDTVLIDNKSHNIVRFIKDPANATMTLHLRAP